MQSDLGGNSGQATWGLIGNHRGERNISPGLWGCAMTSRDDRLVQGRIRGSGALGEKADRLEHRDLYFIWRGKKTI